MRGRTIILQHLICLFYLLYLNIISLISPKITLALLFITCLLQKWNFAFTLRKNWSGQNWNSRTDSAGPGQICSKNCPKYFWNIPKIFTYMLFILPIILVLCSNMNNIDVVIFIVRMFYQSIYDMSIGLFDSINEFQQILHVLLECIEHLTLYNVVYLCRLLLESINLSLAYYASLIICPPVML